VRTPKGGWPRVAIDRLTQHVIVHIKDTKPRWVVATRVGCLHEPACKQNVYRAHVRKAEIILFPMWSEGH